MRHTPRRALRRRLASAPFSSPVRLRPVRHVSTREISGMDFEFSEKEEAFRKDVRAWLEGNVPDDLRGKAFAASRAYVDEVRRLRAWQKTMWEAGYVGMNWPKEFGGRGAPLTEQIILFQEMAHVADWCFLLVRTNPDAPKHKGISFLLVDMKTLGITIRPLRQLTGEAEFNEVFFDNVRVPRDNLVGTLHEGWAVAITTLAYERDLLTFIRHIALRNALHRFVRLVKERKRGGDPLVRQNAAARWLGEEALQMNAYRSLTKILRGGEPGPEGSTSKLFWSQLDSDLALAATEVIGPYAQIAEGSEWAPDDGQWEFYELLARASGIRAGTTEILKNILGERVLGLPKD